MSTKKTKKTKSEKSKNSKDKKKPQDKKKEQEKKEAVEAAKRIFKRTMLATAGAVAMNSWDPFDLGLNLSTQDAAKFTALAGLAGFSAYELWEYLSAEDK